MNLTILGCGRFHITFNYNSTGNVVSTDTTNLLVDFGRGCLQALTKLGKGVADIQGICISHTHPDHVADLLSFFQIFFITCPQQPLTLIGPTGTRTWFDQMAGLVGEKIPSQITVVESPQSLQIGDITVTTAPMTHNVPDIAFRLTHQGSSLVYLGDTGMNDQLITFAKDVDVLLLECSNESGQVTPHHLNEQQCADIAQRSQAKRVLLTHYGDQPFSGTLERAKELLTIKV